MKNDSLGIPLLSSVAIHICVILLGSVVFHGENLRRQDFLPIRLVDLPRAEAPPQPPKVEAPPAIKKQPPPPPPKKAEKPKERPLVAKTTVVKPEPPAPLPAAPTKEEPVKAVQTNPLAPVKTETLLSFATGSRVEGGGSEGGGGKSIR